MKAMYSAPPEEAWRLGSGPFVFSGVPPVCSGEIEVINSSDEKVKVRAVPTTQRKGTAGASGLQELRLVASLAPRSKATVQAHFPIDPTTPAGTYRIKLSCGKQRESAVIHVFENRSYELSPPRIVLRGSGGSRLSHPMVIRNTGNVPIELPKISMVWLEERDWVGRSLVYTLRESQDDERYREFLNRFLEDLRVSMVPATRVALACDAEEILPGSTAQATLKLTLPKELKKGRTYLGFVKLPGKRLWLEVVCNGTVGRTKRRAK